MDNLQAQTWAENSIAFWREKKISLNPGATAGQIAAAEAGLGWYFLLHF